MSVVNNSLANSKHQSAVDWCDRPSVHRYIGHLDIDDRVCVLEDALSRRPDDPFINGLLGVALYNAGDHDRSRHFLQSGFENTTGDSKLFFHMGLIEHNADHHEAAVHWFKKAVHLYPNRDYLALLLCKLEYLERWHDVAEQAQKAHTEFPDDLRFLISWAEAAAKVQTIQTALSILDTYDDHTSPQIAELQYQLLHRCGDADAAHRAHYKAVLRSMRQEKNYTGRANDVLNAVPSAWQRQALMNLWEEELNYIIKSGLR